MGLIFFLAPAAGQKDSGSNDRNDSSVESKIDAYIAPYVTMNDFSGSILIARDGRVMFRKSYGLANLETRAAIVRDTKFRIGSISKQFTAAAIVLLEERNLLHLTDPISKFVPDFPQGEKITLQMLLTHTSGVARDLPDKAAFSKVAHSTQQLIDIVRRLPLESEPGAKYQYSNLEYLLLAHVVEVVSGKEYATFLNDNIFLPLAMTGTGVDRHDAILPQRASGYQPGLAADLINARFEDMSNLVGYGSLYSTPEDLLQWEEAWNTDRVLNKSSWSKMFKDYGHGYGLGISIGTIAGHAALGHDGSVAGFNAVLRSFPDNHVCIIYTGNIESGASLHVEEGLAAIVFGTKHEIPALRPAPAKLAVAQVLPYVGTYALFPGFSLEVILEGNDLYLKGGDSEFLALMPLSEDHFFLSPSVWRYKFHKGCLGESHRDDLEMGRQRWQGISLP